MLLSFDKTCNNFINGCDYGSFFDLLESVLYNFDVAQVLVHQSFLLAISGNDLGKTKLQDGKRILKFSSLLLLFSRGIRLIIIDLVFLFLFIEFFLVSLNFGLKMVFIFFVLGSQSDGLIDLLLSKLHRVHCLAILMLSFLVHFFGQLDQSLCLIVLVHDLSSQHINFSLVLFVLRLGRVETELLLLDSMLLAIQSDLVNFFTVFLLQLGVLNLEVSWLGFDLLDVLFFLSEFYLNLLNLVLKDLQLSLLVFELLSVVVHFTLESLRFTLLSWVGSAADGATCN